ncbi:XCP1, partial [Symbiodinium pilosum]
MPELRGVHALAFRILTDGGTLLWQKYLERKAFSFASNAISDALVSRLRMCYVSHDVGEPAVDGALRGPEWNIEEEPQPCEIDSWARMHLPVRRSGKADEASTSGAKMPGKPRRGQLASSSRPKATSGLSSVKEKPADQPPRIFMLESEHTVDPEEERMREAKAQEEARKRDKERLAKESEKTQEEERRKVQQLHEEMSKRPHTFDTEGNLIWVDELKPERLPKLVEAFGYSVKREPKSLRDDKAALGTTMAAPKAKQRPRRHRGGGRGSKKTDASPEFTDGFSKLQHGQPPILETMVVVPGVTLEQLGKVKSGPDDEKRFLSRREYVQLAEQEVALDSSFHGRGGSTSQDGS